MAYLVAQADTADAAERIEDWRRAFEKSPPAGEGDPLFDISGWISSYDGRPIPEPEMRAWAAETVAQVETLAPARVLEIGCGSGTLLFQLAPGRAVLLTVRHLAGRPATMSAGRCRTMRRVSPMSS